MAAEATTYDLIVIGSGNAGQQAATVARAAGWRVAIIEAGDIGGTCALRGCVPKKVLAAAAEVSDLVRRAGKLSINIGPQALNIGPQALGPVTLDWTALIARERTFVDGVPAAVRDELVQQGIDVIQGRARFVARDAVAVSGHPGPPLRARKFVVATGSVRRPLAFPGGDTLLTSDDLLELKTLPPSIAFVGAGVIAFELAHVMARAGARVTLLESAPRALPGHDQDAVGWLVDASAARGIDVRVGANIRAVSDAPDGTRVVHLDGGAAVGTSSPAAVQELRVHAVAHGAGRIPDLDRLDLAAAGVSLDNGRPVLNPAHGSRSNPDIWFAGDAVPGTPQLSALATYEGRLVGRNLVRGETRAPEYHSIPSVIFATPALATVGPTEDEARARGLTFDVRVNDMRTWRSARSYGEEFAWAKVLIDRAADRIIAAHLIGHGAPETINAFALAIRHGIRVTDLAEGVFAYPTFHSDLKFLL